MRVTVIPIVVYALGTFPKGLESGQEELEIGGRVLIKSARIQRRVLKTGGDLLSLKLQWKTIS